MIGLGYQSNILVRYIAQDDTQLAARTNLIIEESISNELLGTQYLIILTFYTSRLAS